MKRYLFAVWDIKVPTKVNKNGNTMCSTCCTKTWISDVEYFRVIIVGSKNLNFGKFISETRSHNRLDENYQDSLQFIC